MVGSQSSSYQTCQLYLPCLIVLYSLKHFLWDTTPPGILLLVLLSFDISTWMSKGT